MKLSYYADTDFFYIDLSERPSVESREITEGVVLDYDAEGSSVGIDIDNASKKGWLEKAYPKQATGDHSDRPRLTIRRPAT